MNDAEGLLMRLDEIATMLSCTIEGEASTEIVGIATLEEAREGELSFLANPKYHAEARTTRASALIAGFDFPYEGKPLLRNSNPYLTFAKALEIFHTPPSVEPGIHSSAVVSPTAIIGKAVHIGPNVYIGERAVIGERVVIGPNCVVCDDAVIGAGARLRSGCIIRERVRIGSRCNIQDNAVVGSDGFGYAKQEDGSWYRILQCGTVVLEDDVEVGAGTTIDRAALGETRIGRGTKIDNLVQVGHGSKVGSDSLLCAQVGLAGSTQVGKGVILTGQVGAAGHLTIGDGVVATPQTGIAASVEAGAIISGSPAIDHRNWLKSSAVYGRLPEIQKAMRTLERRIALLESSLKVSAKS